MEKISRRQILGRGAAALGATAAFDLQAKLAAHGVNRLGYGSGFGNIAQAAGQSVQGGSHKFYNFLDWWKKHGEKAAEISAKEVAFFDPDILSMRSPSLAFKFNLQRSRNIIRIKEERQRDFERRISLSGFFEWWS